MQIDQGNGKRLVRNTAPGIAVRGAADQNGQTKVQARQRLVNILRRNYHALCLTRLLQRKEWTTDKRHQRERVLDQATELSTATMFCDSETMRDAGYRGRTINSCV